MTDPPSAGRSRGDIGCQGINHTHREQPSAPRPVTPPRSPSSTDSNPLNKTSSNQQELLDRRVTGTPLRPRESRSDGLGSVPPFRASSKLQRHSRKVESVTIEPSSSTRAGTPFGAEPRFAGVGELVDDVDAILGSPLPHRTLLDRDRVLLPVLSGMATVNDSPNTRLRIAFEPAAIPTHSTSRSAVHVGLAARSRSVSVRYAAAVERSSR